MRRHFNKHARRLKRLVAGVLLSIMPLGPVFAAEQKDTRPAPSCTTLTETMQPPDLQPFLDLMHANDDTQAVLDTARQTNLKVCSFSMHNPNVSVHSPSFRIAAAYSSYYKTVYFTPDGRPEDTIGSFTTLNHEMFHNWQTSHAAVTRSDIDQYYSWDSIRQIDLHMEMTAYVFQTRTLLEDKLTGKIPGDLNLDGINETLLQRMTDSYQDTRSGTMKERLDQASVKLYEDLLYSSDPNIRALRNVYLGRYSSDGEMKKIFGPDMADSKNITLADLQSYARLPNGLVLYQGIRVPTAREFKGGVFKSPVYEPKKALPAPKPADTQST